MNSISFDNPYLLLIIIPLVALFVVPYAVVIRKENFSGHNVASCILHVVMAIIIGFAAAGTSIITTLTRTDVYVLADVSYSASRNLDAVDGYIEKLRAGLPSNSRMGVICFANNYRLTTRLGNAVTSVKNSLPENGGTVDDSGTDIISALSYTSTLFREDVIKRIVLITDGRQTTGVGVSELKAEIEALAAKKVHVDAIYLDDNLAPGDSEAQACSANYTQNVYTGSDQRAQIEFRCNYPENEFAGGVQAKIKIDTEFIGEDGSSDAQSYEEPLSLSRGYTSYRLRLNTERTGTVNYSITLEITDAAFTDVNPNNNVLKFTQFVGDLGKTLLLTQREEDYAALKQFIPEDELDYYINKTDVPSTVEELCGYDRIIISNINLDVLDNTDSFIDSLDTVVSSFGKSLMTFGDVYVQSDDDDSLKTLGDMLPVKYRDEGKRLFTIALDCSDSMGEDYRFDRAKEVVKTLISLLDDNDHVQLITFDGTSNVYNPGADDGSDNKDDEEDGSGTAVIPPTPAGEIKEELTDAEKIDKFIKEVELQHGTSIYSALDAAVKEDIEGNFDERRVMLISDGLYSEADLSNWQERVDSLKKMGVKIYTFGVGGRSQCKTGWQFLDNIAQRSGTGKAYDASSFDKLDELLSLDLSHDQSTNEGGQAYVTVKRSADSVLSGVTADLEAANASILNFVPGKYRASATNVLFAEKSDGTTMPLYAYWNYGRGRVATFSCDVTGDNIKNWVYGNKKETLYEPLFANMINTARPKENVNYPFTVEIADFGGYATVSVIPYSISMADTDVVIKVTSDGGYVKELPAAFVESAYATRFTIPEAGLYSITVEYSSGANKFTAQKSLSVSYPPEYDSFAMYDEGVLQNAIGAHGNVVADGELKLENDKSEVGLFRYSLVIPLLITAVALYAVDIAVRKLKKEDVISLFKGVKK